MADETEPGSGLISIGQAARLLMISEERIRQLSKAGYFPRPSRGKVPFVGVVQGYIKSLREDNKNQNKTSADNRVRDARAEEIQIRIAEKKRELIPTDDATAAQDFLLGVVVAELSGLPARVTRDVPTRRLIEKEIDASRNRMASALRSSVATLRTGGDVFGSAAEADTGSVGEGEQAIPRKRGRPRSTRT
ncbi:hypothetical protein I6H96_02480 [Brucella anthropi]|uniref:hypothetical protein n=1 Tax=Brucella anthropi TaxID=529 RepID=UPI0002D5F22D|nr:hypothetical protein [Brucella anthropi]QQC25749.1 hypothetical protein I6H96_02480 [Brucella anthropi]SUA65554.1 Uncharacterised protein [Brucella anthropi]